MRLLHALRCGLSLGALASVACAPALPPTAPSVVPTTFTVRMDRARKPGDRGTLSTVVRSLRATITEEAGQVVKRAEESEEVELEGTEKVLQVSPTGAALALEYTLTRLSVQTPAGRTEVLPRGRIVTAEVGRDKVTFHASPELSSAAEKALAQLFLPSLSEGSDDDTFGTPTPQAIGAAWPVNATALVKDVGALHFQVAAGGVHGQTQLVGLAQIAGQTCLDVNGEASIHATRPGSAPDAPPDTAELRTSFRRLLPVDTTAPELDTAVVTQMDVTVLQSLGPDRPSRTTTISRRETRRRYTPLR